ncbi:hypothetical protein HMI54_012563 [Coelomomyces lativittatus]|nr:hypothetical protein HMI56_003012 [Coelomomyces lativittatus]KAJ1516426.1 hypothetical protein HMI55_002291 [Coelomomyces lativittatus]KAJ1518679.1 hypothetical protein HMI54_012563 [Coelomomyces lativittatus]
MVTRFVLSFISIFFYLVILNVNQILGGAQVPVSNEQETFNADTTEEVDGKWYFIYFKNEAQNEPQIPSFNINTSLKKESQERNDVEISSNQDEVLATGKLESSLPPIKPHQKTLKDEHPHSQNSPSNMGPLDAADYKNLVYEIFGTSSIMQIKYQNFDSIASISMLGVLTALYDLVKPDKNSQWDLKKRFLLQRDTYSLTSLKTLKDNLLKNDFHFGTIFYRGTNTRGDLNGLKSQLKKSDTKVVGSIHDFIHYTDYIPGKLFPTLTNTESQDTQTLGSFVSYQYTWRNLETSVKNKFFRTKPNSFALAQFVPFIQLTGKLKVYETETETVVKIPLQKVGAGQQGESKDEIFLYLLRKNVDFLTIIEFQSLLKASSEMQEELKTVSFPKFSFYDTRIMNETTFPDIFKKGNTELPLLGSFNQGKISSTSAGCVSENFIRGYSLSKFEVGDHVEDGNEVQSKYEMDKTDIDTKGLTFEQGFYFVLTAESGNAPLVVSYVKPSSVIKTPVDCEK